MTARAVLTRFEAPVQNGSVEEYYCCSPPGTAPHSPSRLVVELWNEFRILEFCAVRGDESLSLLPEPSSSDEPLFFPERAAPPVLLRPFEFDETERLRIDFSLFSEACAQDSIDPRPHPLIFRAWLISVPISEKVGRPDER